MQRSTLCFCATLSVLLAMTSFVDAQQVVVLSDVEINPVEEGALTSSDVFGPELQERAEREKRKILEPIVEASFGIKSALLDIIFGKVNQLIDYKTRLIGHLDRKNVEINKAYGLYGRKPCETPSHTTVKPVGSTTTEDIADIDSRRVSLDVPGEIFGTAFTLITKISNIISDVILNTAARTQRLVEAVKPTVGKLLGIKTSRRKPVTAATSNATSSTSSSSSSFSKSARSSRSDTQDADVGDSDPSVSQNLLDLGS